MNLIKLIIVAALLAIVFSMGLAFWRLMHDKGRSDRMVKALTVRVILSIGLFVFLLIAFATGLITPHGFQDPKPMAQELNPINEHEKP